MKLAPLNNVVILAQREAVNRTEGGLYLPGSATDTENFGVVLAVGPGRLKEDGTRLPMDVKVNDVVLFDPQGTREAKLEGKEVIITSTDWILAVEVDDDEDES